MEWKQTLEGMSNSYDLAQRILQSLTDREILPLSPCSAWELENNRCEKKKGKPEINTFRINYT